MTLFRVWDPSRGGTKDAASIVDAYDGRSAAALHAERVDYASMEFSYAREGGQLVVARVYPEDRQEPAQFSVSAESRPEYRAEPVRRGEVC